MGKRLYVGNLPYGAGEGEITEFFQQGSTRRVQQVKIITDRDTGRPRGFAFVELADEAQAKSAIAELHNTKFGGRTIVVNEAHDRPRKSA
ncbi:MAG: RNA-binding protein [Myxococcales bacterium]|nr:RNA-binding protein [Myxococcales bacterium]